MNTSKVLIVDDLGDSVARALGITIEREDEIYQMVVALNKKFHGKNAAFALAEFDCSHPNELALACLMLCSIIHSNMQPMFVGAQTMAFDDLPDHIKDAIRKARGEDPSTDQPDNS